MASNKITPPTNLWGPTSTPTSSQIPDNVIISSDNSSFVASGASNVATNSLQKEQTQQQHERAIHRINLSSIKHNYNCVQTSAARQQCQVIVVVKADAYGRKRAMSFKCLQYCSYVCLVFSLIFLHVILMDI